MVKAAGVVGMGGAGFPTGVKLGTDLQGGYILVNAAECEPGLRHNIQQQMCIRDRYGRMRSKIESTMEEIEELKKIDGIYQDFDDKREKSRECDYRLTRLEMLRLQADIQGLHDKIKTREEGIKVQEHTKAELMRQSGELQKAVSYTHLDVYKRQG